MNNLYEHQSKSSQAYIAAISSIAARFGEDIGFPKTAKACGLLLSFGKYAAAFREGELSGALDYSTPGAAFLYAFYNGKKQHLPVIIVAAIEAICGYGNGLRSFESLQPLLNEILDYNVRQTTSIKSGKSVSVVGREFLPTLQNFTTDFPNTETCLRALRDEDREGFVSSGAERMLLSRMLLSCLADAAASAAAQSEIISFAAPELLLDESVDTHAAKKKLRAMTESLPNDLYTHCFEEGRGDAALSSIVAPASVERTLAGLAFAVSKCEARGHRRIICVLPSLDLIPEAERVYREVFPNLVVDRGQYELDEEARDITQSWDAPCILTTAPVFFESLFSNEKTSCRKLHRIASSVVLLEDLQPLHSQILTAAIECINTLISKYRTSFAVVSSTNPNFETITGRPWAPKVIRSNGIRDHPPSIFWNHEHGRSLQEIAEESVELRQVCVIVNTKKHAREIFSYWAETAHNGDIFMLSSDLCPAHVKDHVAEIKAKLATGQRCKVIATPAIEQGCWAFPVVYRAIAPLPSIFLAANMCSRVSLQSSELHVFSLTGSPEPKDMFPNAEYANASLLTREKLEQNDDLWAPQIYTDISAYYEKPFIGREGDPFPNGRLDRCIRDKDFDGVKKTFCLPQKGSYKVVVPYSNEIALYEGLQFAMSTETVTKAKLNLAQTITVTVYAKEENIKKVCMPIFFKSPRTKEDIFSGVYLMKKESSGEGYYKLFAGTSFPGAAEAPVPDTFNIFY